MPLNPMKFKWFVWPGNPASSSYSLDRSIVRHKYAELSGVELEDMDLEGAIITIEGEFFGRNAFNYWDSLNKVFREGGVGDFYHPVYKDITKAMMKNLRSSLEPRENYVKYSLEIWEHRPPVIVVQQSSSSPAPIPMAPASSGQQWIVRPGDTLWYIANQYGLDWQTLASYNNLANPHLIYPGDVINIP